MSAEKFSTVLPPAAEPGDDPVLTGLRIGNAIVQIVTGPPLNERTVPEPLRFPHPRTPKGGRS